MSLRDLVNEERITTHKTSKQEITQLLALFDRDIRDAQIKSLSSDRKFATAYNAALMISIAALAASGYRASNDGHHYWTIQSLAFTLQLDAGIITKFNKFRQKRNISDYERTGVVSEQEVKEMISLAKELYSTMFAWLKKEHPELI